MRYDIWDNTGEPGTHAWRKSDREYEKLEWIVETRDSDWGGYNRETVVLYADDENGITVRDPEKYEAWLRKMRLA